MGIRDIINRTPERVYIEQEEETIYSLARSFVFLLTPGSRCVVSAKGLRGSYLNRKKPHHVRVVGDVSDESVSSNLYLAIGPLPNGMRFPEAIRGECPAADAIRDMFGIENAINSHVNGIDRIGIGGEPND